LIKGDRGGFEVICHKILIGVYSANRAGSSSKPRHGRRKKEFSMDHHQMKERLARVILEKSFKYSDNPPFTLASGRKSNFYFNCKPTTLDPEGMNLIGHLLFNMIRWRTLSP
jgi:hypothetical protein